MILTDACLSARNSDVEAFQHFKRPVKLVQASLSAGKLRYRGFNHRGGPVKTVKGGFNFRKVGESSFTPVEVQ